MIKIKNTTFKEKFTEINLRQRYFEGKSMITVQIMTEFYPALVENQIVSGMIDLKLDMNDIHSLSDLNKKEYKGDIGSITISVNNHGVWEHQTMDEFEIKFAEKQGNEISFSVVANDLAYDTTGVIVSLYTTSSTIEKLKESFDMTNFYEEPIKREIGKSTISKFYTKTK